MSSQRNGVAGSVFAIVLSTVAAPAAAAPALAFDPGSGFPTAETDDEWVPPILIIYDAPACAPEMAMECELARFDCENDLTVAVDGFPTEREAAAATTLELVGIIGEGEPKPLSVDQNVLDGTWTATFSVPYSQDPGLRFDEAAGRLSLNVGGRSVAVPLDAEARKAVEEFVALCASE